MVSVEVQLERVFRNLPFRNESESSSGAADKAAHGAAVAGAGIRTQLDGGVLGFLVGSRADPQRDEDEEEGRESCRPIRVDGGPHRVVLLLRSSFLRIYLNYFGVSARYLTGCLQGLSSAHLDILSRISVPQLFEFAL